MYKVLYIFAFLFFGLLLSAQDTIQLTNGTLIPAKILEINALSVKFKKFENLEGPIYTEDKKNMTFIKYANGAVDTINGNGIQNKQDLNSPISVDGAGFQNYKRNTGYYKYERRQKTFGVSGLICVAAGLATLAGSFTISSAMTSPGNDKLAKPGAVIGGVFLLTGLSFEIISIINGVKKKKER